MTHRLRDLLVELLHLGERDAHALEDDVRAIARAESLKVWRRERARVSRRQRELHDDDYEEED